MTAGRAGDVELAVPHSAGVRVRPYAPPDRDACLALFDGNVPAFFDPAERAELEAWLDGLPASQAEARVRYLVLEDDRGRVLGCGGWAVADDTTVADLCWGMVARDRQGRGLGRALVEARLESLREAGVADAVALRTSQHTVGFYERVGFELVERVEDGFAPGLHRCEMRRRL